ncbi:MAG TPA: hypothetical protein VG318_09490 [Actinomycetota bacterium]|nr:hypothetical protein [Actinomycetota bacterium]
MTVEHGDYYDPGAFYLGVMTDKEGFSYWSLDSPTSFERAMVPLDVLDVAAEFLEDDVVGLMARFKDFLPEGTRTGMVVKIEGNLVPKRLLRDRQRALAFESAMTDATQQEPLPKTVAGIPWFHGYRGPETWKTNSLPINIDRDSVTIDEIEGCRFRSEHRWIRMISGKYAYCGICGATKAL